MSRKPASRRGDIHSGHLCYPPTALVSGSPNVLINNKNAMRVGDPFAPHKCCSVCTPHTPVCSSGAPTVIVNGKRLGHIGASVSCSPSVTMGSPNVFVGV